MDKITEKILIILFRMGIRPSVFVETYKRRHCNIHKTIEYFESHSSGPEGYFKMKKTEIFDIDAVAKKLDRENSTAINISDKWYPELLKQIYCPPPVLFCKGGKINDASNCIAVVGTRKNTVYGRDAAIYISGQLSKAGITIVSGMAEGIDYWVHDSALKERGGTIGVLGCGIDMLYPASNKELFKKIISNGSLLTEFLPGTEPLKQNFPARNRIISGISMGVVIVEAPEKSGALITAEFALQQDREVFSVPGSIFNPESAGCNNLLKIGAKPVSKIDDILCEISHLYKGKLPDIKNYQQKSFFRQNDFRDKDLDLNRDSRIVYNLIGLKPVSLEEIASATKFETGKILEIIAELEIKNVIIEKTFNCYARNC
ncbi:MAG: DNA-protecting protein DprA [Actinobacteria bacterium]|nr:DNA-protecting protein DprA [Actinomycetota bacterium]